MIFIGHWLQTGTLGEFHYPIIDVGRTTRTLQMETGTLARDILFLLKEDFPDGAGPPYFCPDCAMITGVLSYFQKLKYSLDIRYSDFPAPRTEIVGLIGKDNQNCPVLILDRAPPMDALGYLTGQLDGKCFISGAKAIAKYWSHVYGISRPH